MKRIIAAREPGKEPDSEFIDELTKQIQILMDSFPRIDDIEFEISMQISTGQLEPPTGCNVTRLISQVYRKLIYAEPMLDCKLAPISGRTIATPPPSPTSHVAGEPSGRGWDDGGEEEVPRYLEQGLDDSLLFQDSDEEKAEAQKIARYTRIREGRRRNAVPDLLFLSSSQASARRREPEGPAPTFSSDPPGDSKGKEPIEE